MNLESAAMTALQSGVDPYSSKSYLDWMSSVPEAQTQLPGAIKRQRERQVSELESGIPEKIRTAAQPLARRGLHGSGLQLEDIGQAALDRQIAIDRAKTLAEIDPIQAQIALQDLSRTRAVQRGGEERRRFEREESITESQRARDQLMKTALSQAAIGLLGRTNPLSSAIFGGKGQEGLLQKAIGGIGSLFGGGTVSDTSLGDPGLGLQSEYGLKADTSKLNIDPSTGRVSPLSPSFSGYGDDDEFSMAGNLGYDEMSPYVPRLVGNETVDPETGQFTPLSDDEFAMAGNLTSPYRDITAYEGEKEFPYSFPGKIDTNFTEQPTVGEEDYITSSPIKGTQYLPPSSVGEEDYITAQSAPSPYMFPYGPSSFEGYGDADEFAMEGAASSIPGPTNQDIDNYFLEGLTAGMLEEEGGTMYGGGVMDYLLTPEEFPYMLGAKISDNVSFDTIDDYDFALGGDDNVPFGKTSGLSSTGMSEEMQKAMEQGFANAKITQKLLDEGKIGTEYASLLSDASNYMKDTLPESGTDLLSTAGDIAKLPFQALDAGLKAVGSAKRTVGDLTTKALDTATGGAYSGIRGLGGQAAKAVSDALGGVVSPSTVGSAALTALRGKEGLKSITKDPMGFAGKKLLSSALPSFKSTVGSLAEGSLPSIGTTSFGASQLAANAAYDAALAKGLTVAAADKAALAAYSTANPLLAAAPIAIPMILQSIGSMEKKKSRAKEEREEIRNRAGSAPFNFVPGELWMAGNKRRSPTLDEANQNFLMTDQLTGMGKIYLEDPRRSVMGGDSLSKRGQDFAKEIGIDYKHSDPDVQNTSQKWLGKQQVYSELIPDLKPIFTAGLKGQLSREQTEDAVSKVSNKFFKDNPAIGQVHFLNKKIKDIEHQEADDLPQDKIMALKEQGNKLKEKIPLAWKKVSGLTPEVFKVEFIEDEQE